MHYFWSDLGVGCQLAPRQTCVWVGWWEVGFPDGDLDFIVTGETTSGIDLTATAHFRGHS